MDQRLTGAIRIGDEALPRDDFLALVLTRASQFTDHPTVAVLATPSLETVVCIMAGIEAGATVVPVSPDAGADERNHVLQDSGATLLIEDGRSMDVVPRTERPPADASLLLYTSGTTGPPKGVPITSEAIDSCLAGLSDAWEWTPDDLLVHGLPLNHVHGLVLGVLGPLRVGSGLHHTVRPTPSAYAAAHGSLYFGVPTVWSRVAADPGAARALAGARLLVSGSAALPAPAFDGLLHLAGQAPVERYGMTETLITLAARAGDARRRGTVGRPLPGVEARLVPERGGSAAPGELGELEVRGRTVFAGYDGQPAATAAAFTDDGWFRTGDIASIDADGIHRIVGRASTDLIKSGGYRIGAGEVEDALLSHPSVTEAAVVGEPDDDLGQRIVAYVVASSSDEALLIRHVADRLSSHKRPRVIVFVAALPRNSMGKVDKTRLGR